MTISTYCRFTCGVPVVASLDENPNPGIEIATVLKKQLPLFEVEVLSIEDIQFAHQVDCVVDGNQYEIVVSYDWTAPGWWEIFYTRRLSWLQRFLGKSEDAEMRILTAGISKAVAAMPGLSELRWYATYDPNNKENFALTPEL